MGSASFSIARDTGATEQGRAHICLVLLLPEAVMSTSHTSVKLLILIPR
jgi:hypothetical protein